MTFRFVHAADLHLDCPFQGLIRSAGVDEHLSRACRDATFKAFDALIDLCIARDASFLLLAGDVTDTEERSLRAQFRLRDGLTRLASAGIRSFVAHGNHDPLVPGLPALDWPDAVHIFPAEEVETVAVPVAGHSTATVSGISYAQRDEQRNLAALFPRPNRSRFSIALLHANAGGQPGHAPYAPCTLDGLRASGHDYWALGHVHSHAVLCTEPWIVYPGCTQGLSIREPGARGAVVVEVDGSAMAATEFVPLAPVRWETVSVEWPADTALDGVVLRALEQFDAACARAAGADLLIVRTILVGAGDAHDLLADRHAQDDLLEHLREQTLDRASPRCWLKDIQVRPQSADVCLTDALERQDFLGEVFRVSLEPAEGRPGLRAELESRLAELYAARGARRVLPPLSEEDLMEILAEARRMCAGLLRS